MPHGVRRDHSRASRLRGERETRSGRQRMIGQRTLARSVHAQGIALHSGKEVEITLHPAAPDTGIVFRRVDLRGETVHANVANVVETRFATTLAENGARVATVEHLMAAFAGVGVDNAEVDINATELPILDGSAAPFLDLIRVAGVVEQDVARRYLQVVREVSYEEGEAVAHLRPHDGFRVEYTMDYDHPFFADQCQHAAVEFANGTFEREVSRARTFGFLADMEELRTMRMALGGSLDNAIVVDEEGILNDDGLRYHDEFVKHKILDAVGDLYLCGHPILGAFEGYRTGHATNNGLLRRLLDDPRAFRAVTL